MEPLTIGQKIGFACVVLFVLALTATPFLMNNKESENKELENKAPSTASRVESKPALIAPSK